MPRQWRFRRDQIPLSTRKRWYRLLRLGLPLLLTIIYLIIALITNQYYGPQQRTKQHITEPQPTEQVTKVNPFVTRSGTMLMMKGSPLHLIGYNWHWMGTGCATPTDAEIDATFSQIATASHGNVIRTAFYQSGSDAGLYTDFDRYIHYARLYGLYIVPILVNHLDNCEPAKTMSRDSWYQWGYTQPDDGYPLAFRDYAVKLAQHYANEPTIAFWQLVNEPDSGPCGPASAQTLRNFADDMVTALKRVDPNHMVDLGVPGPCAGDTTADYMDIVSSQVDLCDVWHDYKDIATPLPSKMAQRINICQSLNKPSFVGESGMCAGITENQTCAWEITPTTLQQRATFLAAKLKAGLNQGLAGYILWSKGDTSVQYDIGPDDPVESMLAKYASAF